MGSIERKEQLKKFLLKFDQVPVCLSQGKKSLGPMEQFIITYFGMCFIEGYRIIEKIEDNIFLMSLMQYQMEKNSEEDKEH